jgi:threonylcarbamoyladenosine tRNA methylthiotransferase MtaB
VAQSRRFVPHFHIPLQSGSNKVLKLMRRRYQRELYAERVARIKSLLPDCCIGVDVIVGFPGETHQDFLDTYQFLNELDISYLHVFSYSERDHTLAKELPDKVGSAEKSERSRMLHILSDKKKRAFYESQVGKEVEVLFENDVENGFMHGFTRNYVRMRALYDPLLVNELRKMRITRVDSQLLTEGEELKNEVLSH